MSKNVFRYCLTRNYNLDAVIWNKTALVMSKWCQKVVDTRDYIDYRDKLGLNGMKTGLLRRMRQTVCGVGVVHCRVLESLRAFR